MNPLVTVSFLNAYRLCHCVSQCNMNRLCQSRWQVSTIRVSGWISHSRQFGRLNVPPADAGGTDLKQSEPRPLYVN